jgi:flavin-binding protein dodecin
LWQELDGDSLNRPIQHQLQEVIVPGTVARVTEISAKSDTSFEDAVKVGLDRANSTLRGVTSAWVKEQSVDVQDGAIVAYRVNLLVTFVLE